MLSNHRGIIARDSCIEAQKFEVQRTSESILLKEQCGSRGSHTGTVFADLAAMHVRTIIITILGMVILGCGRLSGVTPIEPRLAVIGVDAGHVEDGGVPTSSMCSLPFEGPDCCGDTGSRVGSAQCSDQSYVCETGTLCTCLNAAAGFHCVDVCGGDAFVSATCSATGWTCASGLIKTSDCPAGTCFGDPGECCIGPQCLQGQWTCQSIREPCN